MPVSLENPMAWALPESGMGITMSTSAGCSLARISPILLRTSYTSRPSIMVSGLAKYTHSNMQWAQWHFTFGIYDLKES